ncbi:MAG: DMT family transporter, partial [Bacillota bacterium]
MNFTKKRAVFELILAGALWGFGFVAATWSLQSFTPIETLVLRFITASVLGELLYIILRRPKLTSAKSDFFKALPAGLLLGGMLLLQTIGLQYTTATKSGFLTSIYVILVPLLNTLFFKTVSSWKNYALAILALLGTFILMDAKIRDINIGDLWTLACSFVAALHIIYIGKISTAVQNSFRFN